MPENDPQDPAESASEEKAPASGTEPPQQAEVDAQRDRWVRDLIVRGEAAWPVNGSLPPGATHEIIEEKHGETPVVVRRRFSAAG
jgi:hypothetical protein